MNQYDFIEYICNVFSINEQIEFFLKKLHTNDINYIISELLLHTRRIGRCITFHELSLHLKFDVICVTNYLSMSRGKYREANYENAINPYCFDLGLDFKRACIGKSFIRTMDELEEFSEDHQMIKIATALSMTLELLGIPKQPSEVCLLLRIPPNSILLRAKMMQCRHRWIPPTNKWANETLRKHVW